MSASRPGPDATHTEVFVRRLFDEMARTYGVVNMVSSLGFAYLWRRRAVMALPRHASVVADLMAGGGECLGHVKRHCGRDVRLDLVDWSLGMCDRTEAALARGGWPHARVLCTSALALPVADGTYDAIVSTFGMKTLTASETRSFAREVRRVLKSTGCVSILEFSKPPGRVLPFFFRLYVKHYVPLLGRLFLGNPDHYRMLWRYTEAFGDCAWVATVFREEGFEVEFSSWFFGSATQVTARLRASP